jgi:hypothetical protein
MSTADARAPFSPSSSFSSASCFLEGSLSIGEFFERAARETAHAAAPAPKRDRVGDRSQVQIGLKRRHLWQLIIVCKTEGRDQGRA